MIRSFAFLLAVSIGLCASNTFADTIAFEDFEDATVIYTTSHADAFTTQSFNDYYGRVGPGGGTLTSGDVNYGNLQGLGYYGAQDTDAATGGGGPTDSIDLDIFGININEFINLNFSFYVAEDDPVSSEDWDTSSSLFVEYRIDGGVFTPLIAFEAEEVAGSQVNQKAREDTDFDGIGDGTELLADFVQFSKSIAGTGLILDLRVNIVGLNAGDEDVAFDNLLITGDFTGTGIPEPGTFLLLFGMAPLVLLKRKRS